MLYKLFGFVVYCSAATHLSDQECSALCTDGRRGFDITVLFQLEALSANSK